MQTKPQPPPGVVPSKLLTIRGREAAHAWLTNVLGATVPLETVGRAASARDIRCAKRGRALYFSTAALWSWFAANYTATPAEVGIVDPWPGGILASPDQVGQVIGTSGVAPGGAVAVVPQEVQERLQVPGVAVLGVPCPAEHVAGQKEAVQYEVVVEVW